MAPRKIAVVLFNLGGPDGPEAVRPFLFNLFNDPAIIALPGIVRTPLAALISSRREASAQANYAIMGGASPLLPETQAQAKALEATLAAPGDEVRCFIAMRYWKPLTDETAAAVAAFGPDEIVLTPLYPQYSTTTTGSSLAAWRKAYKGPGRSRAICCYPTLDGLAAAHAAKIEAAWAAAGAAGPTRLLFSAHGLPESVVARGDPYQAQIEATAGAIVGKLSTTWAKDWDWRISYQSRVGPMKWIGPATEHEIAEASAAGLNLLVVPIAFVSEHIETLVELDHEYGAMARQKGCPSYVRAPALGIEAAFIDGLAGAVRTALERPGGVGPVGDWICPSALRQCPRTGRSTERV
ncbi:ferrochelatase [Caulobacter ginsengisoli]|uniref:Ferrochelatase n=1 Tax=Caulobacter ginsengisoli TaxID=400775 RepID=A0ABU0ITG8_9CAUL|nr:ferrochelatase [Caulobacter ginsengisoli]MDQ0465295.1 ferrochelatase [Caulobacter ginsengisoli]